MGTLYYADSGHVIVINVQLDRENNTQLVSTWVKTFVISERSKNFLQIKIPTVCFHKTFYPKASKQGHLQTEKTTKSPTEN